MQSAAKVIKKIIAMIKKAIANVVAGKDIKKNVINGIITNIETVIRLGSATTAAISAGRAAYNILSKMMRMNSKINAHLQGASAFSEEDVIDV